VRISRHSGALGVVAAVLFGCGDDEGAKTTLTPDEGGIAAEAAGGSGGAAGDEADASDVRDSGHAHDGASAGSGGQAGAGDAAGTGGGPIVSCPPLLPPPDAAGTCGDGVRDPATEECDDGNADDADLCSSACRTLARLVGPPADPQVGNPPARHVGTGRHVVAARCQGFGAVYVVAEDPPLVSLATFDAQGVPGDVVQDVSVGSSPLLSASPVVAGLPDDTFVVAWNDFGGDGDLLGIAMKIVDPATPPLQSPKFANSAREFSQYDADILRVGGELVVAWLDDTAIGTGPDVRFRRFDLALSPLTDSDETLAATPAAESAVALTSFADSWTAAWRSATAGDGEVIRVRAGALDWQVTVGRGGPLDDKPALVELDASHLLLVFSTQVSSPGPYALRGAVLDRARPGDVESFAIDPQVVQDPLVSHNQPAIVRAGERVYLSWRSTSALTGPESEEIWLKEITWLADSGVVTLDLSASEAPLPRLDAHRVGIQRVPGLAVAPLWQHGAIAAVWEDYGRALGTGSATPDVGVQLIPAPPLRLPDDRGRRE
jgi:cysteine-rich repeat protein